MQAEATQVWIRLQQNYSVDEIVADLELLYEVNHDELVSQIHAFIQQLIDRQLIRLSESTEKQSIIMSQDQQKTSFASPVLEIFSDMQEILLLDPVHDVDKAGWPVSKDINSSK